MALKAKIVDRVGDAVRDDLEPGEAIELVVQAAVGSILQNTGRHVGGSVAASALTIPLFGTAGLTLQRSPMVFAIVTDRRLLFIACRESTSGMSTRVPVPGVLAATPRAGVGAVTRKGRIGNIKVAVVQRDNPDAVLVNLDFPLAQRGDGRVLAAALA